MPLEVLACDYWVPGTTTRADLPKYHNSRFWREILVPGDLTCILYAKRATEDPLDKLKLYQLYCT